MDWAKHRRRKAAAKCHMRLDLRSFLPRFAIVKAADTHDATEAWELCSGNQSGEFVVFDKAYIDFRDLLSLKRREVFWVTQAKENMQYEVVGEHTRATEKILRDVRIRLTGSKSAKDYSDKLRLIEAIVEIHGKEKT